jgi:hypothetical protein
VSGLDGGGLIIVVTITFLLIAVVTVVLVITVFIIIAVVIVVVVIRRGRGCRGRGGGSSLGDSNGAGGGARACGSCADSAACRAVGRYGLRGLGRGWLKRDKGDMKGRGTYEEGVAAEVEEGSVVLVLAPNGYVASVVVVVGLEVAGSPTFGRGGTRYVVATNMGDGVGGGGSKSKGEDSGASKGEHCGS